MIPLEGVSRIFTVVLCSPYSTKFQNSRCMTSSKISVV
ncbi:unnamed protein product [Arabidopsis halleri]